MTDDGSAPAGARTRVWVPGRPVPVGSVLSALRRGGGDPAFRLQPDGVVWRATRTPDGPALLRVEPRPADGAVRAHAWGPGADWVLVGTLRQERLLPLAAVAAVGGLARDAEPAPEGPVRRRLPLTVVLRRLARDREPVELAVHGGRQYRGTLERVGADHVDVAVRRSDEPVRDAAERVTLPLPALLQVRIAAGG